MKSLKNTYVGNKLMIAVMLFSLVVGFANASFAAQVEQKGYGTWAVATGNTPAYWVERGFWVDATVENLGYSKEVVLVWTDNDWFTSQTTNLSYEYTQANGKEVWGIDFTPLGRGDSYYIGGWTNYVTGRSQAGKTGVDIKYALRYTVNGNTYWDSNAGQNYSVYVGL